MDKNIELTDELMKKVAFNETGAFESLYRITNKAIYCYILSIIREKISAEDLLQDTYISIRNSISSYNPCNKPMAWIFTIAKNNVYSYLRKQKDEIQYQEDIIKDTNIFQEENCVENIVLNKAMKVLNEKERIVVLLNAVSGYKFREISKYLEIPIGTVLSCYNRGIKKLKLELKEV